MNSLTPSASTVASAAIGIPLATILSWVLNTFGGVEVPGPVEAAFGAALSALIGVFFTGGRSQDVTSKESVNEPAP